jgi:hypothetical protein
MQGRKQACRTKDEKSLLEKKIALKVIFLRKNLEVIKKVLIFAA